MIPAGTDILTAKWAFSTQGIALNALALISSGQIGGITPKSRPTGSLDKGTKTTGNEKTGNGRIGERDIWWVDIALWMARQHPNYWYANYVFDYEDDPTGKDLIYGWAEAKALRLTGRVGKSVAKMIDKGIRKSYSWTVRRGGLEQPFKTNPIGQTVSRTAPASGTTMLAAGSLAWMFGGAVIANSFRATGWGPDTPNTSMDVL